MTGRGHSLAIAAVVALILLAGCAGGGGSSGLDESPTPTATPESTPEPTPAIVRTATETPETESARDERLVDNPWGRAPVVIAVADETGARTDYAELVERAVRYWQNEGATHATWEPEFVVREGARDPDIVVRFVEGVPGCGRDTGDDIVGCASVLEPDDDPTAPEVVVVHGNLSEYGTYATIRHELGHVLGLTHVDEPASVMSSRPSARLDPSESGVYAVHIEIGDGITARSGTLREARHALDYYQDGAGGWMEQNVTFVEVDDPQRADIRIVFLDGDLDGSEGYVREGLIRVDTWDPTTRGWHVGYWLGFFFGAESIEDLPEPFDEPETDDRRRWW